MPNLSALLRLLIAFVFAGFWQFAQAACSPHVGKVVFNELYQPNSGTSFLEIKVLDPSVVSATNNFQNWKIDMYDGSFSRKQSVDVSSGFSNSTVNNCGAASQWIRFPESALSYLGSESPPFNFVLYDSSGGGQIVDILRVGNTINSYYGSGTQYQTCSNIEPLPAGASSNSKFDAVQGTGGSVKDWYRSPDGTGPWGGQGTSNPDNTECGNNSGGAGTFGLAKVPSVTSVPTNTNFTYTLWATNGGTAVSSPASVVITDDLSAAGLTFVSCTATPGTTSGTSAGPTGTCTYSGGVVNWTVGSMAANKQYKVTITVQAATAGAKVNTATSNVGSPFANVTASTVQVYAPLADWRMDESSWSGTANEVRDSSGNGYHGRARIANGSTLVPTTSGGSPAYSSGSQSTCRYGEFDKTSSPARTYSYVELTGIPALPSSFTFAAWIRSTSATAQHQRILVRDDGDNGWGLSLADGTGQGKLRFFNRNITNSGAVSGQGSNPSCGVFCLDTNAVISSNTWYFVAATIDTTGKSITLYVYDSAGTLHAKTSAAFAGTWADGTGTAALGGETSASSEGRQTSWHFLGNIDEVQIYSGVLSQSDLEVLRTRTRNCGATIDHVELVHDGAALTCYPQPVSVLGCTSSSSCNGVSANQTSGSVSFTPTAIAGAQWCTDASCATVLSGSITVANGTTLYLREPTARVDRLAGTASAASTSTVQCKNTSDGAFNATTACDIDYATSGFLMNAANHRSCTAQTISIQAVKSSATGTTCVPAFQNVNRSLSLHSTYTNPSTGTRQASLNYVTSAGGATSSIAALPTSAPASANLANLYFDNTGTATLNNFVYSDVGQLTLQASYIGGASTNDTGLTMATVSGNTFVAAPQSFAFSGIPSAPLTAGNAFNVTLTAMNACATPTTTPNFGQESTAATVALTSTNPQPAAGNSVPVSQTVSGFSNASASTNVTWLEVGTLDLVASISNYLSSSLSTSSTQGSVGRFKPAYFNTAVTTEGCGTFTYSGQPVQRVEVTAKATGGTTTANYAGATWSRQVTLSDANAGPGAWTNNTIAATAFTNGVGSSSTAAYTFAAKATVPTLVKIRATESSGTDGVTSSTGAEGTTNLRSGRVRMRNVYGSERLINGLTVPVVLEYYDAPTAATAGWRTGSDTCTVIAPNHFAYVNSGGAFSACRTAGTSVAANPTPNLTLAQPNGNVTGWVDLILNLGSAAVGSTCTAVNAGTGYSGNASTANAPWLQFDWNGSGSANPGARATFGTYKSPLIYRRENY